MIAGSAVVGRGAVAKEGADVVRVVFAPLVAGAAGADPRARRADRDTPAGEQRRELRVEHPPAHADPGWVSPVSEQHLSHRDVSPLYRPPQRARPDVKRWAHVAEEKP